MMVQVTGLSMMTDDGEDKLDNGLEDRTESDNTCLGGAGLDASLCLAANTFQIWLKRTALKWYRRSLLLHR